MDNITFSRIGQGVSSGLAYAGTQLTSSPASAFCFTAKVAGSVFGLYTIYSLFESAMADILCMKTFRHGTNPWAHLCIHLVGPDNRRAGQGGEARFIQSTRQRASAYAGSDKRDKAFFAVRDISPNMSGFNVVESYINTKCTGKYYALRSTLGFFGQFLPLSSDAKSKVITFACKTLEGGMEVGGALGLFLKALSLTTPTIKLHLDPDLIEEATCRECLNSDDYAFAPDGANTNFNGAFEGAVVTKYQFSVFDIGFSGIVKNGVNRNLFKRIQEHKGQCLWGVVQLVYAVALTTLALGFIAPTAVPFATAFACSTMTFCDLHPYLAGIPQFILGSYTLFQL